ncbi:hypothetical protein FQR65_LT09720 [Abscondita terminalis]|nr:hypothetical protein FQR65_LT09720 [Abscondita terminalis]
MNILLQRHKARYIYVIPEGLRELMSDISREVLRSQPEKMLTFIADYLDALMITRENARVAARTVENITNIAVTIADLLINAGMSREEANLISEATQKVFQKYVADKEAHKYSLSPEPFQETDLTLEIMGEFELPDPQKEQAALIIQRAFRLFKQREDRARDLLMGMVDWRIAARSTMRLYRKLDVTFEEANRAATLIKAAYKGYYTRRLMKRLLQKSKEIEETTKVIVCEEEGENVLGFWEQYEQETVEEEQLGLKRDEELEVDFVEEESFKAMDVLQPLEIISGSTTTVDSGLANVVPVPSAATIRSLSGESYRTEVMVEPDIEILQFDDEGEEMQEQRPQVEEPLAEGSSVEAPPAEELKADEVPVEEPPPEFPQEDKPPEEPTPEHPKDKPTE